MEINTMFSRVGERNEYHFTWALEKCKYTVNIYRELKNFEIRSPVFTAKCLGSTKWYLTLTSSESDLDRFVCSLKRCDSDDGSEMLKIDWRIEISVQNHKVDFEKEDDVIQIFKKGTSSTYGAFTLNMNDLSGSAQLKIVCQMMELFPVKKPVFEFSDVRTTSSYFQWVDLNKVGGTKFFGPQNIRFDIFLLRDHESSIRITISRTDFESEIALYLLCRLALVDGENEVWTEVIDRMCDNIETGAKIERRTNLEDDKIFSYGHYVCEEVKFEVSYVCSLHSETTRIHFMENNDSLSTLDATSILRNVMSRMYADHVQSDVILQVGNEKFPAHKSILSARSPVFSSMLEQDMKENLTGVVTITDMDTKTLTLMLKFIYTGTMDEFFYESAFNLIFAAEKYDISGLKEMCSAYLITVLSEDNVCEVLNAADMVQQDDLRSAAMEYVKAHADKVLISDSWKQLVRRNASVITEILSELSVDFWAVMNKNRGI